jgi:hypothetical protein
MALDHAHAQPVAGGRERDEERHAIDACEPFAAGHQLLDGDLDLVELGQLARDVRGGS